MSSGINIHLKVMMSESRTPARHSRSMPRSALSPSAGHSSLSGLGRTCSRNLAGPCSSREGRRNSCASPSAFAAGMTPLAPYSPGTCGYSEAKAHR